MVPVRPTQCSIESMVAGHGGKHEDYRGASLGVGSVSPSPLPGMKVGAMVGMTLGIK